MERKKHQYEIVVGGRPLTLEISHLAEQANAAVLAKYGETIVLVTTVMGKQDRDADFFPLLVDYEEKFYAAGKIMGSRFMRREGKASDESILSGRLIDRTVRPLFDQRMRRDVQIVITVISFDEENDPDFTALMAASTALSISDIPWNGPVAAVRIAKLKSPDGKPELVINPTLSQIKNSHVEFDTLVAGAKDRINMIELGGDEAKEDEVLEAFSTAQKEIVQLIDAQKKIVSEIGQKKTEVSLAEVDPMIRKFVKEFLSTSLENAVFTTEKVERQSKMNILKKELLEVLKGRELSEQQIQAVDALYEEEISELVHRKVLEKGERPDGRKIDEVRPLHAEVGLFARTHGSALFMRGNTQSLAITTLGPPGAEQLVESIEGTKGRRFMLHYNFPPFSVGEVKPIRGPGRRDIGHGALAEKALRALIPSQEDFPYTIRLVSEILSSNGSSSMASVCAGALSLMDAGVPLRKPAAGIAMGMMSGKNGDYKILTDIQGPEDHHGDMDLKVAGTDEGITAMQMDVKIDGLTMDMLRDGLKQAKKARLHILETMNKALEKPRAQLSQYAPIIKIISIDPSRIGEVIGPGGKVINGIIANTGASSIDIEEDGKVFVTAPNKDACDAAVKEVESIVKEYKIGEIVEGEVIKILEFGAIVGLGPNRDGMIHVSELKDGFVKNVEDVVKLGDRVTAKIIRLDNGKIGLSIKALEKK